MVGSAIGFSSIVALWFLARGIRRIPELQPIEVKFVSEGELPEPNAT